MGFITAIEEQMPMSRFFVCSLNMWMCQTKLIYKSGIIVYCMVRLSLPTVMKDTLLHDAIQRDITTARRAALLEILWSERYLTRPQLIARVELRLRKSCFGILAWDDT